MTKLLTRRGEKSSACKQELRGKPRAGLYQILARAHMFKLLDPADTPTLASTSIAIAATMSPACGEGDGPLDTSEVVVSMAVEASGPGELEQLTPPGLGFLVGTLKSTTRRITSFHYPPPPPPPPPTLTNERQYDMTWVLASSPDHLRKDVLQHTRSEHPSRPFLDQTLREHSGGLVGRAAR